MLDPTNPAGPYYPLRPLRQAAISRYNPSSGSWRIRYRGFIEEMNYIIDPSQKLSRVEFSLVDLFEIVSSIELLPGEFGDPPPASSAGQIFFEDTAFTPADVAGGESGMKQRVEQILGNCGIPTEMFVVFSGNVNVHESVYSPGESAMGAIQEAVDAEFPGVSNVYCDRFGRLCVHGRFAKFDPVGTASGVTPDIWDYREWLVGGGAAVNASPTDTAHLRELSYNRGLSKIINQGLATPLGIADADVEGQTVKDTSSIGEYGIRSWSSQNLITKQGLASGPTAISDLEETKNFASYYVGNYAAPENRITAISFRSLDPSAPGAAANWEMLSRIDIGDKVTVNVAAPGGGGFNPNHFFVEGIHEQVQPLSPDYDDVTMTLDLSPFEFFADNPWAP